MGAVLRAAAEAQTREAGAPRFRVIYVLGNKLPAKSGGMAEGADTIAALRALDVPVAAIPESAVAYSMGKVDMVLVGAEGVVENGGIVSRLGTYQVGVLAKAAGKPVYVVAESHKFVRMFPLGQYDLGVEQKVLEFTTDVGEGGSMNGRKAAAMGFGVGIETPRPESRHAFDGGEQTPVVKNPEEYFDRVASPARSESSEVQGIEENGPFDAVDYTPPDLITALITEAGVLTPSAVSEELIKIWY